MKATNGTDPLGRPTDPKARLDHAQKRARGKPSPTASPGTAIVRSRQAVEVFDPPTIHKHPVRRTLTGLAAVAVLLAVTLIAIKYLPNNGGKAWANPASSAASTASVAATSTKSAEPTAAVTDSDGTKRVVTVITGDKPAPANSTDDSRTPATIVFFHKNAIPFTEWPMLHSAVTSAGATWYEGVVDSHAGKTGFNWADTGVWSNNPYVKQTWTLTIQVYGNFSDAEIRTRAAAVVGPKLADQLIAAHLVVVHPAGFLMNTRGAGYHKAEDFLDERSMVRVSLSPVTLDASGNVVSISGDSGIFVDCLNVWWLARSTPATSHVPSTPPHGGEKGGHPHHPPRLTPKSSHSKDYKQPGDGKERGSGKGKRPKSKITTPPESRPPIVITKPPVRKVPPVATGTKSDGSKGDAGTDNKGDPGAGSL